MTKLFTGMATTAGSKRSHHLRTLSGVILYILPFIAIVRKATMDTPKLALLSRPLPTEKHTQNAQLSALTSEGKPYVNPLYSCTVY